MIFTMIILAIVIGALMPMQAGLNAELTRFLKNPFAGAFVSLSVGSIIVGLLALIQGSPLQDLKRLISAPPHYFLGGILGAIFVGSSLYFIPRMGATTMIAAFVTGQLVMSVIIDHYGFLGLTSYPATFHRILGIILLFVGLFLVVKKPS
jgi:transporter family-2 protein